MDKRINIGNGQEEKIITKELKISKNVFIFNETVIPLCNISRISAQTPPKYFYPPNLFFIVLIGIFCFTFKNFFMFLIGVLLIGWGIWHIYKIYVKNQDSGEYLVLELNSGKDLFIHCSGHKFIIEIMDVIINCLNSEKEYKVNMANCTVESCQFGQNSVMNLR